LAEILEEPALSWSLKSLDPLDLVQEEAAEAEMVAPQVQVAVQEAVQLARGYLGEVLEAGLEEALLEAAGESLP
jgi:transcription termination factor NusB